MHLKRITLHPESFPTQAHYPFNLPVFRQTPDFTFDTPVTLFVGENGSGKSTLLEAIAHVCGIYIWRNPQVVRFEHNPYESRLRDYLSPEWVAGRVPGSFFGAQIFQHFTQALDEWAAADPGQLKYFGGQSLVTKSHGQSLMAFFRSRYRIKGLYLMDEPETALSPRSQLELLELLQAMSSAGHAQFIIATHSPILLACPGAQLCSFDHIPVKQVRYEETDHYRIYRDFLENPARLAPVAPAEP